MKYNKSNTRSNLNNQNINNEIATFNLKIKDIHILLDDKDDKDNKNTKKNFYKSQRSVSLEKNKFENQSDFTPFSTFTNKIYYHKRNINSLKTHNNSMKTLPLNLKNNYFCVNNNLGNTPSLSTTIDVYNNSNLTSIISRKNNISYINTDRIIYSKKSNKGKNYFNNSKSLFFNERNKNKTNSYIKYFNSDYQKFSKKNIYIKKRNNKKFDYHINTSNNIKPFILTSSSPKHFLINSNLNIKNNISINSIDNDFNFVKKNIKKKKIVFNCNINKNKKEKKTFNNNKNYLLYLKRAIIIQKWWKNIKIIRILKCFIIMIQRAIRGYLLRKKIKSIYSINNKSNIIKKILKYNNASKLYFISKCYYTNEIQKLLLIQMEIRKFLFKLKFYQTTNYLKLYLKNPLIHQKPKINKCYINKIVNIIIFNKNNSFINKKIKLIAKNKNSKTIKKEKETKKIIFNSKSMNDLSNSFLSNIGDKNNNITIQTIDSKESQDYFKPNNLNKNKINKNILAYFYFQNLFKNNILHKFYLILLKMKYSYINFTNFIKVIFKSMIRYKKRIFFQNISLCNYKFYKTYKRKENFYNIIIRHIKISKINSNISNEVIKLIENNLPYFINLKILNEENKNILKYISSDQEYNLINTQLFKNDDNGLVNYISLFFKYEKNKNYINFNFIQNRLNKEPLKYRNIFTITRYIDNLEDKINNRKICMNCFCKKNEKKCKLNCNCHYIQNIINRNYYNNFLFKRKNRKGSLKKYKLNINKKSTYIFQIGKIIDKNIFSMIKNETKEGNKSDEYQDSESLNISDDSIDTKVNELYIKKAYTYFGK